MVNKMNDNIYRSKRDSKTKNFDKANKYVSLLITRLLISLIIFLGIISLSNVNNKFRKAFNKEVLTKNISFSKVKKVYNKYLGDIIPLKETNEEMVFNEKITFNKKEKINNHYKLTVSNNYIVPIINSGLVVYVGEKEKLGNTVIIQGIDNIDYWYSNVTNLNVKLYDYVSKGSILGNAKNKTLYLTFIKDGKTKEYEEVVK